MTQELVYGTAHAVGLIPNTPHGTVPGWGEEAGWALEVSLVGKEFRGLIA